ncbi:hypothetical protein, partial [Helicobacter turcicus]|uniref:hypothetical protein n=1 Tax=Helicobacter turcicus TaxID=2867412 RepID=UPI001C86C3BA
MKAKHFVLFATYKVTPSIISEFKKMQDCGVKCVLGVHNTYGALEDDKSGAVQVKTLFGTEVTCLLLYEKDLKDMGLHIEANIGYTLWHSTDYWAYFAHKHFSDFDFYWEIDYDCFLNAPNYQKFFDFYDCCNEDFIVPNFRKIDKDTTWSWVKNTQWAYNDNEWYGSLFGIARYSKKFILALYEKRVAYTKIYENYKDKKQWLMCEFFTATEAMKQGFSTRNFSQDGHQIRINPFDLNAERFFINPDNKIYHPIKEVASTKTLTKTIVIGATMRAQNFLSYKLGVALIENSKSL